MSPFNKHIYLVIKLIQQNVQGKLLVMHRHAFESKKRKIKSKGLAQPPEELPRELTRELTRQLSIRQTNTSLMIAKDKPSESGEGLRKAIQQISDALAEQKQQRMTLEEKITALYTRGIEREKQFQRLLQATIPFCRNEQKVTPQSYQKVQQKILSFFQKTNIQTQNQLQHSIKELQGVMDRKVRMITDYMEEELQNSRKMLKMNYDTIKKEIKQIISLSSSILDENDSFRKKHADLTIKNQILKQQKKMLIAQTLQKKDLILRLYDKLKQKYKKDQKIDEEINLLKRQRADVQKKYLQYEKQIRSKLESKDQIKAKSIYAFKFDDNNLLNYVWKKPKQSKRHNTLETYQSLNKDREAKSKNEQRIVTTVQVRKTFEASGKSFYPNRTQTIATSSQLSDLRQDEKLKELRQIVRAQRKKNSDLTKKYNQLQVCQQQMNKFLRQFFNVDMEIDLNMNVEQKSASIFKNSSKIYHMIKQLQRRLMSSSNPSVNSGYNDLTNLLQQVQNEDN